MSRETCVRLIMGCLFAATVGIATNASATGQVGAMLYDGETLGSTYTTCDWQPQDVYAEAKMYNAWGGTICDVRGYYTTIPHNTDCYSWGYASKVRLRTENTIYCTEWEPEADGEVLTCGSTQYFRKNEGTCTQYYLEAWGYGTN